ncbi:hypothetical protein JCM10021v2_001808 [Rhodotorula toruloides]
MSSRLAFVTWAVTPGVGLATYGYNIMRVLGNKITLHSPSRGFSMELGSAITVVLASQYVLPVSTTMCITGSTVGVALCNGDFRAVNWRAVGWIFLGWVITVPVVGTLAGCLMEENQRKEDDEDEEEKSRIAKVDEEEGSRGSSSGRETPRVEIELEKLELDEKKETKVTGLKYSNRACDSTTRSVDLGLVPRPQRLHALPSDASNRR